MTTLGQSEPASAIERRQRPDPATPDELLSQLPARVILDRISTPVIGLAHDGNLAYANEAYATMLGYPDVVPILRKPLGSLMISQTPATPTACMATLRGAGNRVIDWYHAEQFPIHTVVSSPLLLRSSDPLTIFTVSDITELLWAESSQRRRA